jgi:hypothetical protein
MATWRDVHHIALSFPGTIEEKSPQGRRTWMVKDKFFVWERPLRSSDIKALGDDAPDGPILGVVTDGLEMKEALLGSDPRVYFTTPHFDGYPAVLVKLEKISLRELKDVIRESWLARAPRRVAEAFLAQPQRKTKPARKR